MTDLMPDAQAAAREQLARALAPMRLSLTQPMIDQAQREVAARGLPQAMGPLFVDDGMKAAKNAQRIGDQR